MENVGFFTSLLAGGAAGLSVDVTLFPLDTIKTRLQSEVGFRAAGGFHKVYSGIGPAALGSAPNAAVFFCTYEYTKKIFNPAVSDKYQFWSHAVAASVGEVVACIIRVPVEIIKQRQQTSIHSSMHVLKTCINQEGISGLYRGYFSTVFREIPFSFIQYPLWEYFKKCVQVRQRNKVTSVQSAICGALAGGVAAALTTPLDVAKTRIMLANEGSEVAKGKVSKVILNIYLASGLKGLYAGIIPRSLWMSLGGGIYFGIYEFVKLLLS